MFYIILYIIIAFITSKFTYKYLRYIDKKERKFLKKWEEEYIEAYKDIWREAYFNKLAEEKKCKEYENELKKEKIETKERLKEINIDEEFKKAYDEDLKIAIEKLEEQKHKV